MAENVYHKTFQVGQYMEQCHFRSTPIHFYIAVDENYWKQNVEYFPKMYNIIINGCCTTSSVHFSSNQFTICFDSAALQSRKCFRHVRSVTATFQPQQLYNGTNEGSTPPRGTSRFYVSPAICHFQINITSNAIMQNIITTNYLLWTCPTLIQNKMKNLGPFKP